MKFILHEIKLWFNNDEDSTESYHFLPNKINVITGDSDTGKTSFWSIIDYCLLSGRTKVANTINEKVAWFGINFTINEKQISIVRRTPQSGAVSSDVCFNFGGFLNTIKPNKEISEIKSILDEEFGVTDSIRFPFGKDSGAVSFNISYRHFLLFNSLTEDVIGVSETYFDTSFYGKEEYDKALKHIFDLVIGIDGMKNIKAEERLKEINKSLKAIKRQHNSNEKNIKKFNEDILKIITKCKEFEFIEYSKTFDNIDDAINEIKSIIEKKKAIVKNTKLFNDLDKLNRKRTEIRLQINAINQYQKEYNKYKRNLKKSEDSLQPIEFLNTKLSNQLIHSRETELFIETLSDSLNQIKNGLSKKTIPPIEVKGDVKELDKQIKNIEEEIQKVKKLKDDYVKESQSFIRFGEIKNAFEQLPKEPTIKPIDNIELNKLNDEKTDLIEIPKSNESLKSIMKDNLNSSIQQNFNKLTTLKYSDYLTKFDDNDMSLKLHPPGQLFPLTNIGSKSNYMFLHLCVYLGFHQHMLNVGQIHVPQFLFIDQPSIPYYGSGDNDDKTKLIDAFTLLNSFIEHITVDNENYFQIFMVEHAPKEYWINNRLTHFHLVEEFVNNKGLIPNEIFNS
ncbi:DUF3732 domain-containing protein [Tenacibaculum halocynthiae]|uniref:DUF3732 domain-containing protein n=1 Tax=Tenacibaculum halocynthiae TaxID=1254437 RepID=UPI003893ABDB